MPVEDLRWLKRAAFNPVWYGICARTTGQGGLFTDQSCALILIYTGEKPNRAMEQMVWYYLIGLASLKELEAFVRSRR